MNPIMFTIGNYSIHWYSIFLLIAFFTAAFFAINEAKRFGIPKDFIFNLIFWTLIFGLIGARLYYVLFNLDSYLTNPIEIIKSWNGGLAIHGGIIAGIITIFIYSKKYQVSTIKLLDILAPSLIIAQAIGRWGNFFNSEAHGAATTITHLQSLFIPDFIVNGMNIGGVYYHPTFLYESLWCVVGFIILLIIRRAKHLKNGQIVSIYLIWYGIGRFIIEGMRTDSLVFGGLKVAQLISIIMIIVGAIALAILNKKGKYEDLYNEDEVSGKF